ncbi:endospore coat-associated protein YheD [Clostridium aceticum]|uniref:Endospore coat-associated protein YheD n=1 Tax=Clostridium aceticum TaxID=84022 RepID=A0A0G3WAG1_9CLOT|nr:YheC/YheD family protein [Clostridium aceticum]AKL95358.1 endospore coat-associated protein YheD [Clostridium aceticum]
MELIKDIEIRGTSSEENYLELSSDSSYIDMSSGKYILKAGMITTSADIRINHTDHKNNIFFLSEKLLEDLCIPSGSRLNLKFNSSTLVLGPIIGIFIKQEKIEYLKNGGWDSVYYFFQNIGIKYSSIVYFFTLSDIDWDQLKVYGYQWDINNVWTKSSYPLPKTIYDRCFGEQGRKNAYTLRKTIADKGLSIKLFNEVIKVCKRDTYEHLVNYPQINKHLPIFAPYSVKNLIQFINDFKSVYIKPDKLYKGKGVMKVTRKKGNFLIAFREEDANNKIFCKDCHSMVQQLTSLLFENQKYVLQAPIQLATFLGNRFDIRVMLQKKEPLTWEVTGINARIASEGSVITGPRSGGKVLKIKDVLAMSFPGREHEIIEQIELLSIKIGYKMEEKYGFLGELGIDLGIDVNGKVWLIEVNGRPLKVSFAALKDKAITNVIHQSLMFLSFSLCKFDIAPKIKLLSSRYYRLYFLKRFDDECFERVLFLNPQQMKVFMFKSGQKIVLQVGVSSAEVEVREQEMDTDSSIMYVSNTAFDELPCYYGEGVSLIMVSDCHLVLQPTVGMTISADSRDYLEETYEFEKTSLLALEKGIFLYYFTLDKIDWDRKLVLAHYLNPISKSWVKEYLPFPQVLYDMATFPFDIEKRLEAKEANKRMRKNYDLQVINAVRSLGKWETCNAITFFEEIKHFIPETTLLSPLALKSFLDNYDFIFAKSNYGSFGEEVIRIEEKEGNYLCRTGGSRVKEWEFYNITTLYEFLVKELDSKAILQKGIVLAKIGDRIFDMRILCQKDNRGKWKITALDFRIAPIGGVVTNYSAGAEEILVVPGENLLHPSLSWQSITDFTNKVLLALEATFGSMGEIGLDVGLDMQGNLWLIEANSKPNTIGYRELTTEDVCSEVYGLPLDYAEFLVKRMYNNIID